MIGQKDKLILLLNYCSSGRKKLIKQKRIKKYKLIASNLHKLPN